MTLQRNIVIEAGAGTGKTTRLVNGILQALMQKGLPMTSIVALTFTKKAAGEMKERIGLELRKILGSAMLPETYQSWGHSLQDLQLIAREALEHIDRANISTIHSFAFSILKRFPLEAGIDPNSEIDEKGVRYDDLFQREWPQWLAQELKDGSPYEADWLEILQYASLEDIAELAKRLCDFEIPLESIPVSDNDLSAPLTRLHQELRNLCTTHPGTDKSSHIATACTEVLELAASGQWDRFEKLPAEVLDYLDKDPGETKTWTEDDVHRLKELQQVAQHVRLRGDRIMALLTPRLKVFAQRFRSRILAQGFLSHNALLFLTRELLRKRQDIRLILKREIRMLLIDEFQDTDPLQGELLLFLAEIPSGRAERWQEAELEAGKLFVVGDPKQSIYRFRGADIAAYRQITDFIQKQQGDQETLRQNYRSHDQLVGVVNSAFQHIIQEQDLISPPYVSLEAVRAHGSSALQDVELRLVRTPEKLSSEEAQEIEAADTALWIESHVGMLEFKPRNESARAMQYRDIALVFRSTAPMRFFVEALRERQIPFVLEGERYFYSTPEVTDFMNLLRVVENPRDRIALVGFLRSNLGGLTDPEIVQLQEAGGLDASRPLPDRFHPEHLIKTWTLLHRLHTRAGREPLKAVLAEVFEETFVLELAASSYHRDQTVANLLKLRRLLESFAEEGVTTLRGLLDQVNQYMTNDRLEGESPLADENYNAVRLLTIHKAKGLEFPVVFLPGLHVTGNTKPTDILRYDWSTDRLGLRLSQNSRIQNLEKIFLDWDTRRREREEDKRVLYVAATRARERLIFSGGITLKQPLRSNAFLKMLLDAWRINGATVTEGPLAIGAYHLTISQINPEYHRPPVKAASSAKLLKPDEIKAFVDQWQQREAVHKQLLHTATIISPTAQSNRDPDKAPTPAGRKPGSTHAFLMGPGLHISGATDTLDDSDTPFLPNHTTLLGTLLHRFLQQWDFQCAKCDMPAHLRILANNYFGDLGLLRVPLPDPKAGQPIFSNEDPMQGVVRVIEEAQQILAEFIGSEAYKELQTSEIMAREMPFIEKRPDGTLMRGVIDLLYRDRDGTLTIGDYKSDKLSSNIDLVAHSKQYLPQALAYQQVIETITSEKPRIKMIYLRHGRCLDL